jgi:hypothetical protein
MRRSANAPPSDNRPIRPVSASGLAVAGSGSAAASAAPDVPTAWVLRSSLAISVDDAEDCA